MLIQKYDISLELRFDRFFGTPVAQDSYKGFIEQISTNGYMDILKHSDLIVVHPEGVMEKWRPNGMPFAYFGRLGKELGVEAWIVNFSLFDPAGYEEYIKCYDYVACRDPLTLQILRDANIDPTLSFDCCVLSVDSITENNERVNSVALIRGRNQEIFQQYQNRLPTRKYDCAWSWQRSGIPRYMFGLLRRLGLDIPAGARFENIHDCVGDLSRHRFAMTTSYHANIFCFLAGIPFIALELQHNKKYLSTMIDLVPEKYRSISVDDVLTGKLDEGVWREDVIEFYKSKFGELRKRAKMNVPVH